MPEITKGVFPRVFPPTITLAPEGEEVTEREPVVRVKVAETVAVPPAVTVTVVV
jgi:hypothetical protein